MNANRQAARLLLFVASALAIGTAIAGLNPQGAECGDRRCSTVEYCSPYDKRCQPCSSICDANGRNYQQDECFKDCQGECQKKKTFWKTFSSLSLSLFCRQVASGHVTAHESMVVPVDRWER